MQATVLQYFLYSSSLWMNSYQSIFVVSEHCTQQELSEISPLTTLGSSCMTSRIESYISHPNSSFININIARIGLERLSRVIKMKIRQFKRNSLEAIKIVSVVDKETKREHQSRNQPESRRRQGLEKSKSESKIELKRGERDRGWKYEDKLVLKSFIIEEEGEPVSSSKASLYKTGEKGHVSTQQSSTKKVSEGMYFKKLRQNIMNIKTQLNQIQRVNHDLHAENQRLKSIKRQQDIAHHSSRNRSTPSHTFFHPQSQYLSPSSSIPPPICSPPVYITTPANNCTRCGDRFVPPMKIISSQRNCLGCAYY